MSNQTSSKVIRLALLLGSIAIVLGILSRVGIFSASPKRNATVQGTVTIDGDLAERGTVTFHPVNGGPVAVGQIHSDGSYSLSVGRGIESQPEKNVVFPGEHLVTVMVSGLPDMESVINEGGPPLAGPRLVAVKYTSKETSELKFHVKPGKNLFVLAIEGVANDQVAEEAAKEIDAAEETSSNDEKTTPELDNTTDSDTGDVTSPSKEEDAK